MSKPKKHFVSYLLEEISLEGLEGVTLSMLWKLLQNCREPFPLVIDPYSKDYIWRAIRTSQHYHFFLLPENRPDRELFNRANFLYDDNDTSTALPPEPPIFVIEGNYNQGSCPDYHSRESLDSNVISQMNLKDVVEQYGETRFVIVSNQKVRIDILMTNKKQLYSQLTGIEYAVLERIGRCRHNGLTTNGANSLANLLSDAKQVWYIKKKLTELGLLKTQTLVIAPNDKTTYSRSSLLHLPQFFCEYPNPYVQMLEQIVKYVESTSTHMAPFLEVKNKLNIGDKAMRNLMRLGANYMETADRALSDLYPDLTEEEIIEAYINLYGGSSKMVASRVNRSIKVILVLKPFSYEEFMKEDNLDYQDLESERNLSAELPAITYDETLPRNIIRVLSRQPMSLAELTQELKINFYSVRFTVFRMVKQRYLCTRILTINQNDTSRYMLRTDNPPAIAMAKSKEVVKKSIDLTTKSKENSNEMKETRRYQRKEFVLTELQRLKLIPDLLEVRKQLMRKEADAGLIAKMDRKSFKRIIDEIVAEGLAKFIDIELAVSTLKVFCLSSLEMDDPHIKEYITYSNNIQKLKQASKKEVEDVPTISPRDTPPSKGSSFKQLLPKVTKTGGPKRDLPKNEQKNSYRLGLLPRLKRKKILHQFLWYVVYCMPQNIEPIKKDEEYNLSVYFNDYSWKRYIRSTTKLLEYPHGWFVLNEVLMMMPLMIFTSIINIRHVVPGLEDYLRQPRLRILPLFALPENIQSILVEERLYVLALASAMKSLGVQNLISIKEINASKSRKELLCYLHRNASLLDTRSSEPGYMYVTEKEYPELKFTFNSALEVERYWEIMREISLNSNLGTRKNDSDADCTLTGDKPKFLNIVRSPEEVCDDGSRPLERMGSCGLDASEFCHITRNWVHGLHQLGALADRNLALVGQAALTTAQSKLKSCPDESVVAQDRLYKEMLIEKVEKFRSIVPLMETLFVDADIQHELNTFRSNCPRPLPKSEPTVSPKKDKKSAASKKSKSKSSKNQNDQGHGARASPLDSEKENSTSQFDVDDCETSFNKEDDEKEEKSMDSLDQKTRSPHDELDKAILSSMFNKRVKWTSKEDYVVIMCKVASLILTGNHNIRDIFCLPWSSARDIIRSHCPDVGMNKSSYACNRRVNFLIKYKPDIRTNFNVLLTEAMNDQEIVNKYFSSLSVWNQRMRRDFNTCLKTFNSLVDELLAKFTMEKFSVNNNPILSLPSSLKEIERDFILSNVLPTHIGKKQFQQSLTVENITLMTLYNVILGAFQCESSSDKMSGNMLSNIITQYPQNLVSKAIDLMQGNGIVTQHKHGDTTDFLKISNVRLKLTQRYEYRCLSDLFNYTRYILQVGQYYNDMVNLLNTQSDFSFSTITSGSLVALLLEMMHQSGDSFCHLYSEENIIIPEKLQNDLDMETNVDSRSGICSRSGVLRNALVSNTNYTKRIDNSLLIVEGLIQLNLDSNSLQSCWLRQNESWSHIATQLTECFYSRDFKRTQTFVGFRPSSQLVCVEVDDAKEQKKTAMLAFIETGQYAGKFTSEIRKTFPNVYLSEEILKELLVEGEVHFLGITEPQFISRKYLRPWLLHAKAEKFKKKINHVFSSQGVNQSSTTESTPESVPVEPDDTVMLDTTIPSSQSRKRLLTETKQDNSAADIDEIDSFVPPKKAKLNECFFVPEPWLSSFGEFKTETFKAILENVFNRICKEPGLTLSRLTLHYESFLLPRTVRKLAWFLHDIEALTMTRVETSSRCGLFSARQEFTVSDTGLLLANDCDLTLIPSPYYAYNLGGFIRLILNQKDRLKHFPQMSLTKQLYQPDCQSQTINSAETDIDLYVS